MFNRGGLVAAASAKGRASAELSGTSVKVSDEELWTSSLAGLGEERVGAAQQTTGRCTTNE